jgi:tetratricopeptide (TPR) repeat protein
MKCLLILFTVFTTSTQAQSILTFNKPFIESEDKWVAFQKDKDSTYMFGFIYIDAQAGLTLNYEGNFTISAAGTFIPKRLMDSTNLKMRLEPNNVRVAFISEDKFAELHIPAIPDWLKYYKTDSGSVERLYNWGYMYNGWNLCAKGLTYLERAQKINPAYKGLAVELAFSYNCLSQFDKAIAVLQHVLETNPTDAYINKDLIYAQIQSGQLDKAAESCKKAIAVCKDKTYNGENCYNLLHNYYLKKDKANFSLWLTETKKWTSANTSITRSIKIMEDEFAK